jgi:hypothetical protein
MTHSMDGMSTNISGYRRFKVSEDLVSRFNMSSAYLQVILNAIFKTFKLFE